MKYAAYIALALLLVAGGYFLFTRNAVDMTPSLQDEDNKAGDTVVWESRIVEAGEFDMPQSEVSVRVNSEKFDLGTVDGSCAESNLELLTDEISSYLCWWAGAGTEFGVFREGTALTVRKGVVEEGGADFDGFRGDFETVVTVSG